MVSNMGLISYFALTSIDNKYTLLVINLHLYILFVPAAIFIILNSKEPNLFYLGVGIILISIVIGIYSIVKVLKK
jgi:hypothetical protein